MHARDVGGLEPGFRDQIPSLQGEPFIRRVPAPEECFESTRPVADRQPQEGRLIAVRRWGTALDSNGLFHPPRTLLLRASASWRPSAPVLAPPRTPVGISRARVPCFCTRDGSDRAQPPRAGPRRTRYRASCRARHPRTSAVSGRGSIRRCPRRDIAGSSQSGSDRPGRGVGWHPGAGRRSRE